VPNFVPSGGLDVLVFPEVLSAVSPHEYWGSEASTNRSKSLILYAQ